MAESDSSVTLADRRRPARRRMIDAQLGTRGPESLVCAEVSKAVAK